MVGSCRCRTICSAVVNLRGPNLVCRGAVSTVNNKQGVNGFCYVPPYLRLFWAARQIQIVPSSRRERGEHHCGHEGLVQYPGVKPIEFVDNHHTL